MDTFYGQVTDSEGNAVQGVSVTVNVASSGSPATLYEDDEATTKSNPLTTDANGEFSFKAANDLYDLEAYKSGVTGLDPAKELPSIVLYDPDDSPVSLAMGDLNDYTEGTPSVGDVVAVTGTGPAAYEPQAPVADLNLVDEGSAQTITGIKEHAAALRLSNDVSLEGDDTGGTARRIVEVDSADRIQIGNGTLPTHLNGTTIEVDDPVNMNANLLDTEGGNVNLGGGDVLECDRVEGVDADSYLDVGAAGVELCAAANLTIVIDNDNDQTDRELRVRRNSNSGTILLTVDEDGVLDLPVGYFSGAADGLVLTIESSSAAQTFALTDQGTMQVLTGSTNRTWTVPPNSSVAFPVGTVITCCNQGTGQITLAEGSGVTINSPGGDLTLDGQHAQATLVKTATNTWQLEGRLTT